MPELPVYLFKKDKYRRNRGGKTKLIDIYCSACSSLLLVYQKDMPQGALKRCYLDRIFWPEKYSSLQHDASVQVTGDLPNLACGKCSTIVGTQMLYAKHGENRLAYRMIHVRFTKKNSTHGIGEGQIASAPCPSLSSRPLARLLLLPEALGHPPALAEHLPVPVAVLDGPLHERTACSSPDRSQHEHYQRYYGNTEDA